MNVCVSEPNSWNYVAIIHKKVSFERQTIENVFLLIVSVKIHIISESTERN